LEYRLLNDCQHFKNQEALVMLLAFLLAFSFTFSSSASMQARNVIEGRVSTSDGRAISSARITLQNDAYSNVGSGYTDAAGRFRFVNISNGNYNVILEPGPGTPDFERQIQQVQAQAFNSRRSGGGEIFRVDFVIKPRASSNPALHNSGVDTNVIVFHQDIPENARKEYDHGIKQIEKGDVSSATQSLQKAIAIFPDYYDALELLGTQYVKRQDYNAAKPLLSKAVAINRDGWRGFYSLGIAQMETKEPSEGIKSLKRAAELNPGSPNVNMRLGMVLMQNAATRAEAIQSFEKVTRLAKDSVPPAFFYLGVLYGKSERYGEAAAALEHFLHIYPQAGEQDKLKQIIAQYRQKSKEQKIK
jgi:tetratricopeptide (TPR) repeat protein